MQKFFVIPLVLFTGCQHNEAEIFGYNLDGYAQKASFLSGSIVGVSQLHKTLTRTGRNYATEIIDNSGSFELTGIKQGSKFVRLTSLGFYFDGGTRRKKSRRFGRDIQRGGTT